MSTQREVQYNFGRRRIRELLTRYKFVDIRAKRTGLDDWSAQFARVYLDQNPNTPKWDELPWVPVSEVDRSYPEIWPVFRERICLQSTISHASIGDIIDSQGKNTSEQPLAIVKPQSPVAKFLIDDIPSGASETVRKSKKASGTKAQRNLPDGLVNLKQEEAIASLGAGQNNIDLTNVPSPHGGLQQEDWVPDNWDDDGRGQSLQADFGDSGVIDLTADSIVDLTQDMVIDLTKENPPKDRQTPGIPMSNGRAGEEDTRKDDSDNDSLFDGSEPDEISGDVRIDNSDMLWHLSNNSGAIPSASINSHTEGTVFPPSGPPVIKKGRKRALDFEDEASAPPVQSPRKKRLVSRTSNMPSLLTAVKGKVVKRGRNGEYRSFNADSSAGSALAARMARYPNNNAGPSIQGTARLLSNVAGRYPITDPDELEDYEDEEEITIPRPRSPSPDPETQALRDKWNQVEDQKSSYDLISHLLNVAPSLPAPPADAPPLFLLRISQEKALRLMARNPSPCRPQWYLSSPSIKSEQYPDTKPSTNATWKQHKEHLLTLLPEYHNLAWRASLARREELQRAIDRAELTRDVQGAAELMEKMRLELASTWRLGEKERTKVIPRMGDISDAESILFEVRDGNNVVRLEDLQARQVGGWAELVLYQHRTEVAGSEEREVYEWLARMLEKEEKFLVVSYPLVDEHHKHPHTLLIVASKSRKIGELCGLPEDMMRTRRSLVIVHIGRSLPIERLSIFEG